MTLVEMNTAAGFLVLFIIFIRKKFLIKLPTWTMTALWIMVALRLIFPYGFMAHSSILNLWNRAGVKIADKIYFSFGIRIEEIIDSFIGNYKTDMIIKYIWFAGVIVFGLYYLITYIEIYKKTKNLETISHDNLENELKGQELHRKISVKTSSEIGSPCSFGCLRPVIIFPKNFNFEDKKLLKMVVSHECIHIQYFHFLLKLFVNSAFCVFWFNPIMWLIKIYFDRDCEIFCDSHVIKKFGNDIREPYAKSLIEMAKTNEFALCSSYNLGPIEERIKFIMTKKKLSLSTMLASILVLTGSITVFATSPTYITNTENLDIIIIEEIYEPEVYLNLTAKEIEPYIVYGDAEERAIAPNYIDIQNYKYSTSGNAPATLNVTVNKYGYNYSGVLNMVKNEPGTNGGRTAYYSGKLYR